MPEEREPKAAPLGTRESDPDKRELTDRLSTEMRFLAMSEIQFRRNSESRLAVFVLTALIIVWSLPSSSVSSNLGFFPPIRLALTILLLALSFRGFIQLI